jgi:RNA polymerase sigma-70 factor (ECF subfamily)
VFGYVRSRVRNGADAEDVTAEVFHRALRNLSTFRDDEGTFRAWLFRIAHNHVVDYLRTRRPTAAFDEAECMDHPTAGADPQMLVLRAEDARRLVEALRELPAESREVVALRMAGGLRYAEIAGIVGQSEDAVKMRFHRAIRTLRARWPADE